MVQAGWDEATQIRREVGFTRGRIIVRGKLVTRGKAKRADYVLYYQHMLIVLRSNHRVSVRALPEPRRPLSGSLEQIREDVQRLESLGIGHVFFDLVSMPVNEQLGLLEKLRRVADGV